MHNQGISHDHFIAIQALYPVASYEDIQTFMEHSNADDCDEHGGFVRLWMAQNDDDDEPPPSEPAFALPRYVDLVDFMAAQRR